MDHAQKARIRDLQRQVEEVMVEGEHTPEEIDALQQTIEALEQSVVYTT